MKRITLLLCILFSSSVFALPPYTIEKTYFETPEMKKIVGYSWQGCVLGSQYFEGKKTAHVMTHTEEQMRCPLPWPAYSDMQKCMTSSVNDNGSNYFQALSSCRD